MVFIENRNSYWWWNCGRTQVSVDVFIPCWKYYVKPHAQSFSSLPCSTDFSQRGWFPCLYQSNSLLFFLCWLHSNGSLKYCKPKLSKISSDVFSRCLENLDVFLAAYFIKPIWTRTRNFRKTGFQSFRKNGPCTKIHFRIKDSFLKE